MPNIFVFSLLILLSAACVSVPKNTHQTADRIATGVGPEDLLLDTISSDLPRILVSCMDHRLREAAPNGAIYAINLDQDSLFSYPLERTNEPDGHDFHPHGFDLIRRNGKAYLFVVSHDEKNAKHFVYKYEVQKNTMKFIAAYENALMNSPNTVVALRNGGFYTSIDQGKRGNKLALLFRAKTGSIVFCDEKGGWAKVASKLAYPNGLYITAKERYLYASTTRQHQIFKFGIKSDGNLISKEKVAKLAGGDNIRLDQNKELLIPSHPKIFKFVGHSKDSTKHSPSLVYSLNMNNGEKKVVYSNDGQQISASSTAISYKDYIFISQVYQPFILRIKKKK
ncbi:SMP-30/gluconolactonase/LRE family protein [Aureispira anguillae]|uniref:SMP-30/gluconolactonase/LRE family protein n=1 Tax=Aureispira anguillae TaxID=2864201 RepID=A0A916DT87_9BACT|nr:SMP-30/gluconolactonase/LRE family protein [Aureispira anguillae]BDS11291.1 SMP-30/gluconolactonase/LRE family protein [Aureispira anguillae]